MEELAKDAAAMERRINNGVNAAVERLRYLQLTEWIENAALRVAKSQTAASCLSYSGDQAAAYLSLVERLQHLEASGTPIPRQQQTTRALFWAWLSALFSYLRARTATRNGADLQRRELGASWRKFQNSRPAIGRHNHPAVSIPDAKISVKRPSPFCGKNFFRPGKEVSEQMASFDRFAGDSAASEEIAQQKADFYAQAAQKGLAVVEVITFE